MLKVVRRILKRRRDRVPAEYRVPFEGLASAGNGSGSRSHKARWQMSLWKYYPNGRYVPRGWPRRKLARIRGTLRL
ncbi:hypothetical protein KM043_005656 [Ampulex compressa]|nr:hypothetical protein KM043_005656 [Ampulex compressa]